MVQFNKLRRFYTMGNTTTNRIESPVLMRAEYKIVPRWLILLCIAALLTNLALLLWFAASTNVWDDETNGYFLARLPIAELISAMYNNIHEDPPAFDFFLWFWIHIAGYSPILLRLLPVMFWIAAIAGMYLIGKRLGGKIAGLCVLIAASLMPYHWLFPMALRWYSLAASLAIWNLYFLLIIWNQVNSSSQPGVGLDLSHTRRLFLLPLIGYGLTGAALWYTNYAAPAYFLGHLIIILIGSKHRLNLCFRLIIGWILVLFLYLPWLSVFFRQFGGSVGTLDPLQLGLSIYVMLAGEFSTPFDWWISVPLALVILFLAGLTFRFFNSTFVPLIVFITMLSVLTITGSISTTRRMILVSPFAAMTIGLALAAALQKRECWTSWFLRTILGLSVIVLMGSTVQMFSRTGWASHRWLDPVERSVKKVEQKLPEAVFLTNSNSVAFYRKDPFGIFLLNLDIVSARLKAETPKVFSVIRGVPNYYMRMIDEVLSGEQRCVYIHLAYANGSGSITEIKRVVQMLNDKGYSEIKREFALKIFPVFHRFIQNLPSHRVDIIYFSKEK